MAVEPTAQDDQRCVCSHSISVHGMKGDPGCAFCSCTRFTRPEVPKNEIELGKYPAEAFQLLMQDPELRDVAKEAVAEFVKDGHGRMFAAGAYLVHRGDRSQNLHVILQGTVTIESKEGSAGHEAGVGVVAGDVRAFTEDARDASIYANENVLALEVDTAKLRDTFHEHPDFFMTLVQSLGKFSDNADELISATIQAALEQHTVDQADERREGLDPKKALEIAARWRKLKEEDRAAADRAREAAQKAINSQTGRR